MKTFLLAMLAATTVLAAETENFHALLDREWEYSMKEWPTAASSLGDRRWNDKWPDITEPALARRVEHARHVLAELTKIDQSKLSARDQTSYDLFKYEAELGIQEFDSRLWTMPVNQREGIQTVDDLADALRFETVKDYEDWVARLRTLPKQVDDTIALMRLGIAEKRTHAKQVLLGVPGQIRKQIVEKPEESPFFQPFKKWPAEIGEADRNRIAATAQDAIRTGIVPAFQRFADFFDREYLPACTEQVGAWQWPNGDKLYAFTARKYTTTQMTPREIHELGLKEVARILGEMDRIITQVKWEGTRTEFFEHLRSNPKFYCKTPEELLIENRAVAKRIDPTLVKLFKTLPRIPYGVDPIPAKIAPNNTAAYYRPPAADGSRAGTYFVNLYRPQMRPRYEMMALAMHEAVPGHHFQFAIAYEQGDLPKFRRYGDGSYTAFVEGWALYAESLGDELGLYDDPYSKFGQLTYEIWRACRLVVDTGMHTMKWTRQQAIDYLLNNSAKTVLDVENEIDRYISWPGQALAYKVGELKIKALRAKAKEQLREKFDVREFHDVVLRNGAVPLQVLESQVDQWVAEVKAAK
jgi:prolyl oligopeptidase